MVAAKAAELVDALQDQHPTLLAVGDPGLLKTL